MTRPPPAQGLSLARLPGAAGEGRGRKGRGVEEESPARGRSSGAQRSEVGPPGLGSRNPARNRWKKEQALGRRAGEIGDSGNKNKKKTEKHWKTQWRSKVKGKKVRREKQ